MLDESLKIFEINTDAYATNRGFYYQYLVVLKKWIKNFISEKNDFIYSEVDDDVKEVGEKLTFTQVKCYSKSFSFNSNEIKKSLFNYFILFLKNNQDLSVKFCFTTNSSISKKEKLLKSWYENPNIKDENIRKLIIAKVKTILNHEISLIKRKKLEKSNADKESIKKAANEILKKLNDFTLGEFIQSIKWEFSNIDPETAIENFSSEIKQLLSHSKFKNKPIPLLESVLLSEIYKCSQAAEKDSRILTNKTINNILEKTESELNNYKHHEFLDLIGFKFQEIKIQFEEIQKNQESFNKRLDHLENRSSLINKTNEKIALPKKLTLLPTKFDENIYGRNNVIIDLKNKLDVSRILSISGSGGHGKTFLVQNFILDNIDFYDHVIWINSSASLLKSVVLNVILLKNLGIDVNNRMTDIEKLQLVCNELNKIKGNNLLIIDNYESEYSYLKDIVSISNWKIIITTREIVNGIVQFRLPDIDTESAKKIYEYNLERNVIDKEETFHEFLQIIDYNPLIIKLSAKVISRSVDLKLKDIVDFLKNQTLDNDELKVDISLSEENSNVKLLSYLLKRFELKNLSTNEELYLEFLALLPSEDIIIDDLAHIGGIEFYRKNLLHFTNLSNSLHQKGWVERTNGTLKMHRLVQELIIYNVRNRFNGFISCAHLIIWLFRRIDEVAQSNPSLSFKYLKYAESILSSIKEPYRTSIYQPLLLLENAVLNAYTWIEKSDKIHNRWIDLTDRAKNFLPNSDGNLAVIYNNLGFSYARQNDIKNAMKYFNISVDILKKNEKDKKLEKPTILINAQNNLVQAYIELGYIPKAKNVNDESKLIFKKYKLNNDQFVAAHYYVNGVICQKEKDIEKAIVFYEKAIKIHTSIETKMRNDFYLQHYYAHLIYSLFILKDKERTQFYIEKFLNDFENKTLNKKPNSMLFKLQYLVEEIYNYFNLR